MFNIDDIDVNKAQARDLYALDMLASAEVLPEDMIQRQLTGLLATPSVAARVKEMSRRKEEARRREQPEEKPKHDSSLWPATAGGLLLKM